MSELGIRKLSVQSTSKRGEGAGKSQGMPSETELRDSPKWESRNLTRARYNWNTAVAISDREKEDNFPRVRMLTSPAHTIIIPISYSPQAKYAAQEPPWTLARSWDGGVAAIGVAPLLRSVKRASDCAMEARVDEESKRQRETEGNREILL